MDKLTRLLIKDQRWVELEQPTQQKHLRVAWEGLFFSKFDDLNKIFSNEYLMNIHCFYFVVFWHADKSVYQRETSMKISKIMEGMATGEQK